jgi:hypothetical protein
VYSALKTGSGIEDSKSNSYNDDGDEENKDNANSDVDSDYKNEDNDSGNEENDFNYEKYADSGLSDVEKYENKQ